MTRKRAPAKRKRRPNIVRRMTPEERRAFVNAAASGRVVASNSVPTDLLGQVFMPLLLGPFQGWTEEELGQIGLIWADLDRDRTCGGRAVNGYPVFPCCRVMHAADWRELRPKVEAEIARRKEIDA